MSWVQISPGDGGATPPTWLDTATGQTQQSNWQPTAADSGNGQVVPNAAGGTAKAPAPNSLTATAPYATTTIGYGGNQGLGGTQQPGIFGQGTFMANPYAINDAAITGTGNNPDGNYGLNNVWGNLSNAVSHLQPGNFNANAPQGIAAQGTAAQGSAAQGAATLAQGSQGSASSYSASQASAAQARAAAAAAAYMKASTGNASSYNAAMGGRSASMAGSSGVAALGNVAGMTPAQMAAAQGGYATAGTTGISTAGDAAWQAQQHELANTLNTQANGGGWSPADQQLARGRDQQLAGQMAMLGSQRGGAMNAGLAQRSAADQTAATQADYNQQLGIQRAQETLSAQQALGQVAGTARGQSQAYNANQAQLLQGNNQFNAGNANAAVQNNTQFRQAAALENANLAQGASQANMGAGNAMTQFDVGQQNAMLAANMGYSQGANQFNAANSQQVMQANQAARNAQMAFNAQNAQGMTLANMNSNNMANQYNATNAQQAGQFNAGLAQQTNQFNAMNSQAVALANQNAFNQANQYNATNAQGMTLANMNSQNQFAAQNQNAMNAMTGQNLAAQNQFGMANLGNMQAMNLQNLSNQQTQNLTNQNMLGQYGLANQNAALQAQQQYYNQFLGLNGAMTGIGQANRSAWLADQQLQTQQQIATNQTNSAAFTSGAQANGALSSSVINGLGTLTALAMQWLRDHPGKTPADYQAATGQSPTELPAPQAGGPNNPGQPSAPGTTPSDPGSLGQVTPSVDTTPATDAGGAGLSDENVKTGIQGGNPMVQSFLEQLRASQLHDQANGLAAFDRGLNQSHDDQKINVMAGADYRGPKFGYASSGGKAGTNTGKAIGAAAGGVAGAAGGAAIGAAAGSVVPGIGTAIGAGVGLLGSLVGGWLGGQADDPGQAGTPTRVMTDPGSGVTQFDPIQDLDMTTKSDDQAKENVISGNRGMQAFLEQANSQQQAQSTQGSTNNAFMQTGQAPKAQVDRQMPDPNAGYGGAQSNTQQGFVGANTNGGVTNYGNYGGGGFAGMGGWQGGGWQGATMADQGNWQGGGIANAGGWGGGGMTNAGGWSGANATSGGFQGGGVTQNAGITQQGGITQGSSITNPGGVSQGGGLALGSIPASMMPRFEAPPPWKPNPTTTHPGIFAPLNPPAATSSITNAGDPTVATLPGGNFGGGSSPMLSNPGLATPVANYDPTSTWLGQVDGGISGISGINGLSDEREKTDVAKPKPEELQSFLDSIHAHQYRYKDPDAQGAGHGTYVSPMAQEIESTPLGEHAVFNGPDGHKMVDYGKLSGTMLAGQAYLNERVNNLEGFLKAAAKGAAPQRLTASGR